VNDEQLRRYSRHILLSQIDFAGQEKLLRSRVLVIGVGGLGSPVVMYLASSGVGHVVISDDDQVDLTNLQRQIVHRTADVGRDKVSSARDVMLALNPGIEVSAINARLSGEALREQVRLADVVVDASDNFATRFALNEACVMEKTPLVSGSVIRMEGQVTVFRADQPGSPCYRCLYKEDGEAAETCGQGGVFAPAAGIIASIQVAETLKLLLDIGDTLAGRLMLLDALTMNWRTIRLSQDPACPVCAARQA